MMTLADWEKKSPLTVGTHKTGARWVPDDFPNALHDEHDLRWELWHLSDYRVSSVSGGTIWLIPKKQETVERIVNRLVEAKPAARVSYIGGGIYSVEVSREIAAELQKVYPRSFRKPHDNPDGTVWFGCTEKASQIAKAYLAKKGVTTGGSAMWDLEPGEMPSW